MGVLPGGAGDVNVGGVPYMLSADGNGNSSASGLATQDQDSVESTYKTTQFSDGDSVWTTSAPTNPLSQIFGDIEGLPQAFGQLISNLTGVNGPFSTIASAVNAVEQGLISGIQAGVQAIQQALNLLQTFVQNIIDALISGIRGIPFVGGTLADILSDITGLNQTAVTAAANVQATQNVIEGGLTGVPTTTATPDTVAAAAANTAAQIAANAAALNALQTRSDGGANSGLTWGDEIETVQPTGLDPGFWDSGHYTEGDATIGYIAVVDGHNAGMVQVSSSGAATQFFVYEGPNADSSTDYQNNKVVMAEGIPQPGPIETRWAAVYVYARISDDGTVWTRVAFRSDGVVQFEYQNGGTITTLGTPVGGQNTYGVGKIFGIEAGVGATPGAFRATINGTVVANATDTAGVTGVGVGFRKQGWGQRLDFGYPPGKITQYGGNDNQPAPTVGRGVNIYRASTGTQNQPSGSAAAVQFSANFFDTVETITPGFTVNLSTGGITILEDGWYTFTVQSRFNNDGLITASKYVGWALMRDQHKGAGAQLIRRLNFCGVPAAFQYGSSGSAVLYVHGGEEFFAASFSSVAVGFQMGGGDPNGVYCYFGAALTSNTT